STTRAGRLVCKSPSRVKQPEGESLCEDQGELRGLLDLMSENQILPDSRNNTITEENKALDTAEGLLENQHPEMESRLSPAAKAVAPEGTLSSCTVVEGLLFPVEYYVRTTRRMSNCQRKVDLDAVILSQLGRSKKGQRSKCKQKDANPNQPSQEGAEGDLEPGVEPFPFLGAENDQANSSSSQKSLPENCDASLERSSSNERRLSGAAALGPAGPGVTGATQPAGPDPPQGGSLVPGKCHKALLEQVQHPPHSRSSSPMGSQGPAALGLPAADPDTRGSLFSFHSLQWLIPQLGIRDFHLPNEEFGVLKLEKLKSSPVNDLEDFVSGDGVAPEDTTDAQMKPEEKSLRSNLILPSKTGLPELPCMEGLTSKKELSTHELLFTPMGTVLEAPTHPEPEISSSVFPAVGATPGVLPSVHTEVFPDTPSVSALPVTPSSPRGAAALVLGDVSIQQFCLVLAGAEYNFKVELCSFFTLFMQMKDVAEPLTAALPDGPREESLQFVSELKEPWCSGAVDVGAVWWAAAGSRRELRVVTACESAVSLWQPRAPAGWARLHTWHLREIPVIQIVPLPDTCNLVCVALGELEIGEIRLLLYSSETDSFKHSLVKTGNIKAVAGLKDWRLVSSSRTMQEQHVEMVFLSETGGSKDRQTLMPPEETVTAFAEVEGMSEALVGTTAGNSVVVWNLRTGQLLRKMHIGYSYPASICHRAYSDSVRTLKSRFMLGLH
uniref:Partner and localizer of BRCA2 n=1 Tax=Zonotrichia albicollis TaxID=44394 RepID=A0A8D2MM82_ZONAL